MHRFCSANVLIVASILFFSGCAPNVLLKRENIKDGLRICLSSSSEIDDDFRHLLNQAIAEVIQEYNAQSHAFQLQSCGGSSKIYLMITVNDVRFVSPERQIVATIITTVGAIGMPLLLFTQGVFPGFFFYFPFNRATVQMYLKDEQSDKPTDLPSEDAMSQPFYGKLETQQAKQALKIKGIIMDKLLQLDKKVW